MIFDVIAMVFSLCVCYFFVLLVSFTLLASWQGRKKKRFFLWSRCNKVTCVFSMYCQHVRTLTFTADEFIIYVHCTIHSIRHTGHTAHDNRFSSLSLSFQTGEREKEREREGETERKRINRSTH